ncbi:MAG: glycosyltransferase [Povalibacter sp.]
MKTNLLRILISIACVALLFATTVDLQDVVSTLTSFSVGAVVIAFGLVALDRFTMTFKWLLLLKSVNRPMSMVQGMTVYCTSTLLGSFLPSTAGSDVIRGVWATRLGLGGAHVTASIVVERFIGFLSVVLLALASQVYLATRTDMGTGMHMVFAAGVCIFIATFIAACLLLHPRSQRWMVALMPARIRNMSIVRKLLSVLDACRELGAERSTLAIFFGLTLFEQFLPVASVIALAKGLGLEVAPGWLFSGVMSSLIVARLPVSIDGIGVFDGLFATLMTLGGVPASASVAITFVGRILQMLACAPWALAFLAMRKSVQSPSTGRAEDAVAGVPSNKQITATSLAAASPPVPGLRVGIMLRHYDQKDGGVRVYTRNLLPRLFARAPQHQFVVMHQNPALIGTYRAYANVKEVAIEIPGSIFWDQVGVPWRVFREKIDVLFNPKFAVPLLLRRPKLFVLHGSEWFAIPRHFLWYDRLYLKLAVPLYLKSATAFIAVSQAVKRDAVRYMDVDPGKVEVIHNGFDASIFQPVNDVIRREQVAHRYRLPKHFILWASQIESRKNIGRLLQAFARIKDRVPHDLVFAGAQRFSFPMAAGAEKELELVSELGLENRVHFPGWIAHDDLPALYSLADLFALPSLHEGFGIPLLEAMACGCPILTANTCSPPEVTSGAAYLVDPLSVDDIANGMLEMLSNEPLRLAKAAAGIERARNFSWDKCAAEALELIERVAYQPQRLNLPQRSGWWAT